MFCPYCNESFHLIDKDLPPMDRTEANLWKAKYFESIKELQKANKGIYKLRCHLNAYKERYGNRI